MPVKHAVFLRLKPTTPAATLQQFFQGLAGFGRYVPGMKDFSGGPYSSPEGLNKGYTHGFVMTFADEASRNTYLDHPEHEKIKHLILPWIEGGLEGVVAFDWLT
jgi:hypothetical protein